MNFIIVNGAAAVVADRKTNTGSVDTSDQTSDLTSTADQPAAADNRTVDGSIARSTPDRRSAERPTAGRNRRWSRRDEIEREGFVSLGADGARVACRVRDISQFGAMIELSLDDARNLPDAFSMVFVTNRIRSEATCVLRWRTGGFAGVSFAGPVRTTVQRDGH